MPRTKRPKLVIKDDLFRSPLNDADCSRQIKLQPEDANMYENASWVVAGTHGTDQQPWVSYLRRFGARSDLKERVRIQLDPVTLDVTVHVAFCHGHVPPYAYADWLEENGVDLPEESLRILRWQN